jgi:hypothetical protein
VNSNFGVPKEKDDTIYHADCGSGCPPKGMKVMETKEEVSVYKEDKVEVVKNMTSIQLVVSPHTTRFWTIEEHK